MYLQHYERVATYKHTTTILQCPNKAMGCVAALSSHTDLMRHMRECTADKDEYTCKSCEGDFPSRAALLDHMRDTCSGDRRKQLVNDDSQEKLQEIARRMEKERPHPWVEPVYMKLNWSW